MGSSPLRNPAMLFAFTHHEALKNQGLLKETEVLNGVSVAD